MEQTAEKTQKSEKQVSRPPIVVVVGHIDHGKTKLLDAIRKTAVAEKEAGGITQAIGAYQIEHQGRKITFIDTPGHEAFSAMRGRGAHVADIAALVVAADEGVKPQTEEAIGIIQSNDLPFAVAINKIDKPNADPARVRNELAKAGVMLEGLGGTVPAVEISAKSGQGIDALLETILLLADLEELKTDPEKNGEGVVVESHLDPKRGATATLLIEDGAVRGGDFMVIGDQVAPLRVFEDFRGQVLEKAGAAEPIRVTGFAKTPALGEKFFIFKTRTEAEEHKTLRPPAPPAPGRGAAAEEGRHVVSIVLKTDVLGSQEAVLEALGKLTSPELSNRIVKSEVGDINESDVKLAAATENTFIAGFRVKIPNAIRELAERNGVTMVMSDVIYDLLDAVRAAMLALAPVEIKRANLGQAVILAVFKEGTSQQIAGGRMEAGKMRPGARFDIVRNGLKIGSGKIMELQSQRQTVEEITEGREFGIMADADMALAAGDRLECFVEEKVRPAL